MKWKQTKSNKMLPQWMNVENSSRYACELWDNCGIGNSQKLEQLQLPELLQAYLWNFLAELK
jgi:hypothetical protein